MGNSSLGCQGSLFKASSYKKFSEEMQKVFDWPAKGKEAVRQLTGLKQGSWPVYDYAIKFCTSAMAMDWNTSALYGAFFMD